MKKLLSIALCVILALTMAVSVYAEEINIALTEENWGANSGAASTSVVWGEGTITAPELNQFSLKLPTACVQGDTVVLHIKGTSESDFRVWLLASNAKTASNQWKATDNGYTGTGAFEYYIELTCQYFDAEFETAEDVNFKAASYNTMLVNFTLEEVSVMYGTLADLDAAALEEVQPYVEAAETAIANGDEAAAREAIAVIAEKGALGFNSCNEKVKELEGKLAGLADDALLASLQEYVDKVTAAYETAKNANGDVAVISAAYEEASTAADYVFDAGKGYEKTTEKGKELRGIAKEIKTILADAEAAAEEAARIAAEEEAARAAQAKMTTIIIVAVVAVVVVVAAVVVVVLAKKKKK